MNKPLIVIAAVGALAAVVVFQQMQITDLRKQLAERPEVERIVEKAVVPAPAPSVASKRAVATRTEKDEPAEVTPAAVPAKTPAVAASAGNESKSKGGMGEFIAGIGSMMTNPAMKQMIRAQSKMQLDMQYERLFKFLNKPAATTEALKELLMDRQMAMMDVGMSFMSGKSTPEERKAQAAQIKAMQEASDKKIADLLGPDDFDAYKQYENTQPERMQVDMFKHSLASSGEPLTEQQEYDLVNAMYSARTNAPAMNRMMKQDEMPDPAQFTGAGMTNMMAQMDAVQKQYAATAEKILTPAQNQQFQKYMEQQKAMNEMGMKFAAQMFGGSNAVPANVQVQVQTR